MHKGSLPQVSSSTQACLRFKVLFEPLSATNKQAQKAQKFDIRTNSSCCNKRTLFFFHFGFQLDCFVAEAGVVIVSCHDLMLNNTASAIFSCSHD